VGGTAVILGTWLAAGVLAATAPAGPPVPDVTIVGDSVMTGVLWHPAAVSIVQDGLRVKWDVAVCRTLAGISCPFEGTRPPTLLDVVAADGQSLGKTVVVELGYNDAPALFPSEVEESIDALLAAGVRRILWVDLHEERPQYTAMNGVLASASARHPELTIVDWNGYAQSKYGWFQSDGIHLTADGGVGLATLLHAAVWKATDPPLVTSTPSLPPARVDQPYVARLRVGGGRPPYAWRAPSGPLPRGLHLRPDGRIDGTPKRAGRTSVAVAATDAAGVTVDERVVFVVQPAG
jgi:hypothetical protein